MSEYKALELALDEDLRELSRYLWRQGLPHRITEQSGKQIVWVREPTQVDPLRELYARWRRGDVLPEIEVRRRFAVMPKRRFDHRTYPVTLILIALSVLGYLVAAFDTELRVLPWLTFFELHIQGEHVSFALPQREYWRLITPIFLHFGLLHIVFNMLWFWDLGGRMERAQGAWRLIGIVLLLGLGSNVAQAIYADAGVFGGMSGVIYGLLGYCWTWGWLRRDPALHVPTPVVTVMVVWLLLCIAGFTELLGVGATANAAHVGGFVLGLLLGAAAALMAGKTGS